MRSSLFHRVCQRLWQNLPGMLRVNPFRLLPGKAWIRCSMTRQMQQDDPLASTLRVRNTMLRLSLEVSYAPQLYSIGSEAHSCAGLSAPAAARLSPLANISERDRSTDSDAESVDPATISISELTRVQVVESRRKSMDSVVDSGIGHEPEREFESRAIPMVVPPPPVVTASQQDDVPQQRQGPRTQSPPRLLNIRPLVMQPASGGAAGRGRGLGLPSGPKGRLEISKPIRRDSDSDAIGGRNAFQRPRPAPLKLQNSNDSRTVAPEPPRDGFYF